MLACTRTTVLNVYALPTPYSVRRLTISGIQTGMTKHKSDPDTFIIAREMTDKLVQDQCLSVESTLNSLVHATQALTARRHYAAQLACNTRRGLTYDCIQVRSVAWMCLLTTRTSTQQAYRQACFCRVTIHVADVAFSALSYTYQVFQTQQKQVHVQYC